ncbi:hypothetical protein BU23DRAFT_663308 [Bimuria novae-zelandiae CBS 107.79]|uniref:Pectin lyase-like protein n=1 Tax=Bimuria novae-zelandiae CBS 107.79 TaxID=1447943 RepID=A0A6A5UPQ8_9PLEO|nr:hypothetical protein BU23DRAFT_663308 [Bimuria novae-zelandiae CBS 107.79]
MSVSEMRKEDLPTYQTSVDDAFISSADAGPKRLFRETPYVLTTRGFKVRAYIFNQRCRWNGDFQSKPGRLIKRFPAPQHAVPLPPQRCTRTTLHSYTSKARGRQHMHRPGRRLRSHRRLPRHQLGPHQCGNNGTIVLPAAETYSIHTPLNFSPCRNCDVQIEGTLILAASVLPSFAAYNRSVFTIANATVVRIRSVTGTGVVDGNALSWYARPVWSPKYGGYPFVHITNGSSSISVSNLHFKNIQDRVFLLQGGSEGVRFDKLRVTAEGINAIYASFDNFAFEMGDVSNVSISNVEVDFRAEGVNGGAVGTCIALDHGTDGVDVLNVSCRNAWMGAAVVFDTIYPRISPSSPNSTSLMQNVRVSNFFFAGVHATGVHSWFNKSTRVLRNVSWEDVYVASGAAAEFNPCYATMRSTQYFPTCVREVRYEAEGLAFRRFRGAVGKPPAEVGWGETGNGMVHVEVEFEDWVAGADTR